jgi:hypothetical protein
MFPVYFGCAVYLLIWGVFACFGWLDADPTRAHAATILVVAIAAGLIASSLAERVSLRDSRLGDRVRGRAKKPTHIA